MTREIPKWFDWSRQLEGWRKRRCLLLVRRDYHTRPSKSWVLLSNYWMPLIVMDSTGTVAVARGWGKYTCRSPLMSSSATSNMLAHTHSLYIFLFAPPHLPPCFNVNTALHVSRSWHTSVAYSLHAFVRAFYVDAVLSWERGGSWSRSSVLTTFCSWFTLGSTLRMYGLRPDRLTRFV